MFNAVLDLFKGFSILQWGILIGGIVLLWPDVLNFFIDKKDSNVDEPVKPETVVDQSINLTKIVSQWEVLYDNCRKNGLEDAANKLKEVFPMLVNTKIK